MDDRVGVDVTAQVQQIGFLFDRFDFVVVFEQSAAVSVAFVVGFAVAVKDPLGQEPSRMLAVLADQVVIVVGQQAVGDGRQG
jgi:hypothetical protein